MHVMVAVEHDNKCDVPNNIQTAGNVVAVVSQYKTEFFIMKNEKGYYNGINFDFVPIF